MTKMSMNKNDYYCYNNKTIDVGMYTIIESKIYPIFLGFTNFVKLIRQYSEGSVIVEPDFITASLNPYTNKTPQSAPADQ